MKNVMKAAHQLTREIKAEYPNVDYLAQLGICIAYLSNNEGVNVMVELKGSEKQIAWAEKIRTKFISEVEFNLKEKRENLKTAKHIQRPTEVLNNLENLFEEMKEHSEAKWWIENQSIARHIIEKAAYKEL